MNDSNRITAEALKFWLKETNMKQSDLAEKTGISQGHISNMSTGTRGIPTANLEKICEVLGISIPEFFARNDSNLPEVSYVPRVSARPRAGNGGLEVDGGFTGYYSFHTSFLQRKNGSEETMRIFAIDGNSMEPTLQSGDLIMVNLRQDDISSGQIYLLRFEHELMVKRLEKRPGGVIRIRSDNDYYEPIDINPATDEGVDFQVFGRMVWSCREY